MAQSVQHVTEAPMVPGRSLGHSLLSGQNLGACVSCDRIGKMNAEACDIRLACASVIKISTHVGR